MIRNLCQIEEAVLRLKKKHRVAVAWPHDINGLSAINKAVKRGLISAILIGNTSEIRNICSEHSIDERNFILLESDNEINASCEAVRLARDGEADIVMKGLVGTDKFLKAVMDKDKGLMIPGAVLSYVCAMEIPAYNKILFVTDPAVIPCPNLEQKVAMAGYAIEMAQRFGIEKPKIALIGASEKMSRHFNYVSDYSEMLKMASSGKIANCEMDGPLDIFCACDKESVAIKGIATPINGEADILLFPSLESSNPFYKGLMLFAQAELAGLIRGTEKPVIVMSRSESEISKYFCIALSCLMAN
jgi:phosphate butyryltransferase